MKLLAWLHSHPLLPRAVRRRLYRIRHRRAVERLLVKIRTVQKDVIR